MSFRRIHTDEKPLTVELAKQIYEMPPLRGEREFKESRAKYLVDRIRSGEFADPTRATCLVSSDPDLARPRPDGSRHCARLALDLP
jgi:hypothetical protein